MEHRAAADRILTISPVAPVTGLIAFIAALLFGAKAGMPRTLCALISLCLKKGWAAFWRVPGRVEKRLFIPLTDG